MCVRVNDSDIIVQVLYWRGSPVYNLKIDGDSGDSWLTGLFHLPVSFRVGTPLVCGFRQGESTRKTDVYVGHPLKEDTPGQKWIAFLTVQ